MEDVLAVYQRPYDPERPQVCMDEKSVSLVAETRTPQPVRPGHAARIDYEYERKGVANLFLFMEPLTGRGTVQATERRTKADWARAMKDRVDTQYPDAKPIVVVLDNLTTHVAGSLYDTYVPAEARRILDKLELRHTPKHGSWLNMAEIGLSIVSRQCLSRRIASQDELNTAIAAWQQDWNTHPHPIRWRFTTADARIKLQRLYPSIQP